MSFLKKLAITLGLLLSLDTQALTIVVNSTDGGVGGPNCTLADAIIAANTGASSGGCPAGSNGGDEIVFDSSLNNSTIVLTADLPAVTDDLIVTGPSVNHQITISGNNNYSIFIAEGVRLELLNLKLTKGYGTTNSIIISGLSNNGGALAAISGALVTIRNCTLSHNSAYWSGGAVFAENDSSVQIFNSDLIHNHTIQRGGGIAAVQAQISVQNSTLSSNSSNRGGAAWTVMNSSLVISDSNLLNNSSILMGGAILNEVSSSIDIVNSELSNNSAGLPYFNYQNILGGGAIASFGNGSSINVVNSTFSGNNSYQSGGAIHALQGTQINLNSVFLLDNYSSYFGGAIYSESSATINITRSFIANNSANKSGGALYALNNAITDVIDTTLSNNTANVKGGAMYIDNSNLELISSTVSGNNSGDEGGTVYANNGASIDLQNSTFAENIGGSVFTFNSSSSVLRNTVLADGHCDLDSSSSVILNGGVHIDDGTCGAASFGPSQLTPLTYNGSGPIPTHLPTPGSPLIDHGVGNSFNNPATDQRGYARIVGVAIDIGATELSDPPMFDSYSFSILMQNLTLDQTITVDLESYILDADSSQFKITATGLPKGLILDNSTNVLSGAAQDVGSFMVEFTIEDDTGNKAHILVETRVRKSFK